MISGRNIFNTENFQIKKIDKMINSNQMQFSIHAVFCTMNQLWNKYTLKDWFRERFTGYRWHPDYRVRVIEFIVEGNPVELRDQIIIDGSVMTKWQVISKSDLGEGYKIVIAKNCECWPKENDIKKEYSMGWITFTSFNRNTPDRVFIFDDSYTPVGSQF